MPPAVPSALLDIRPDVATALAAGRAVVALESTVLAHGLPNPENLETVRAMETAVRDAGAVPATVGLVDGRLVVGLDDREIARFAEEGEAMAKVSRRDLAAVLATGRSGATTVAGTMIAAALAGIRVFATGGIGGVHRGGEASLDVSADLQELARTPVAVVASGAKSILDLPRTLEMLETLGVPVIGLGTNRFPAFFTRSSGLPLDARVDGAAAAADLLRVHWGLGLDGGVLLCNPVPSGAALDPAELDAWLAEAAHAAAAQGVSGAAVTPFLLSRLRAFSGGRTLAANKALLLSNAAIAADIAVAFAAAEG